MVTVCGYKLDDRGSILDIGRNSSLRTHPELIWSHNIIPFKWSATLSLDTKWLEREADHLTLP
jgi:hypothetical protein